MLNINGPRRILIIGSSGTGKTYFLRKLFKLLKNPNEIYFFSTTLSNNRDDYYAAASYFKYTNVYESNIIPDGNILLQENNEFYQNMRENPYNIVVIDDVNKKDMNQKLLPYFTLSRHVKLNMILIYQRYFDIPITIRENTNLFIIFKSGRGYDQLYMDMKKYFKNDKRYFDETINKLYKREYAYKPIIIDVNEYDNNIVKIFDK